MIDFTRIDYLNSGNVKQKRAYRALTDHRVLEKLQPFDPVLTGTIPINIDIDTSDLDIICCFASADHFKNHVREVFGTEVNFKLFTPKRSGAVAASFMLEGFVIEIYGQSVPVLGQAAYRHMIIEYKILQEKGEAFRQQIIELKKQGIKTEPAFGKLLGIDGDVYEKLLNLYNFPA